MDNLDIQPEDLAGHGQEFHIDSKPRDYKMISDVTLRFDHQYMPVKVIKEENGFYTVENEDGEIFINCEVGYKSDSWTSLKLPHITNLPASYLTDLYMKYGSDMNYRYRGCMLFGDLHRELKGIQKQKFKLNLMEKAEELTEELYNTKYGEKTKIKALEKRINSIKRLINTLNK